MSPGMSLYSINAIVILSSDDGSRIFAKYYTPPHHAAPGPAGAAPTVTSSQNPYPDKASQVRFEKGLLAKTAKQQGDILLYDNRVVLYKCESDVALYVVGSVDDNEIMLYNVLLALRDSLHLLFKQSVDKRTTIENYDLVSLAIDEIVDEGIPLETDPTIVVQRCSKAPSQDVNLSRIDPFSEQGVNNLAQLGRAKLTDWLRQGL
ncbi:Longin-like domain-containing protein [Lasiosphaeria miniovina]|uniref:Coatomer subunit zeta n=1 Tax=Lasiosphaeria miniovina TaxID=1954250 RepID=A0AA40BGT1_9PEZI|nr:Longin-like domain-containing protein [Lasiosphaeria miniovina]KAK0733962.1 Longin-like domain-containing protein [Lasiosphaeria miniovina]